MKSTKTSIGESVILTRNYKDIKSCEVVVVDKRGGTQFVASFTYKDEQMKCFSFTNVNCAFGNIQTMMNRVLEVLPKLLNSK